MNLDNKLIELGFNLNSIGFEYWKYGIFLWKDNKCKYYGLMDLYEDIANHFGSTSSKVERCMRFCSYTSRNIISNKYKYYNKITNRTILNLLVNEIE